VNGILVMPDSGPRRELSLKLYFRTVEGLKLLCGSRVSLLANWFGLLIINYHSSFFWLRFLANKKHAIEKVTPALILGSPDKAPNIDPTPINTPVT